MSDPFTNPTAYDFFTLDGNRHPGVSYIESGGERTEDFQDQQVPLTTGATTIFRFEPNGEITYTIALWNKPGENQIGSWEIFVAMLNEGKARRPQPRVYTLADERLADVKIASVSFKGLGPRMIKRGDKMLVKLTLKEVRRQRPYGGVAVPDNPAFANEADRLRNDINALRAQRAQNDINRAARAGK